MDGQRALWVDDKYALRCRSCEQSFSLVRRKHHCRGCGQIFCSSCLIMASSGQPSLLSFLGAWVGGRNEPAPGEGATTKFCRRCALLAQQNTPSASPNSAAATPQRAVVAPGNSSTSSSDSRLGTAEATTPPTPPQTPVEATSTTECAGERAFTYSLAEVLPRKVNSMSAWWASRCAAHAASVETAQEKAAPAAASVSATLAPPPTTVPRDASPLMCCVTPSDAAPGACLLPTTTIVAAAAGEGGGEEAYSGATALSAWSTAAAEHVERRLQRRLDALRREVPALALPPDCAASLAQVAWRAVRRGCVALGAPAERLVSVLAVPDGGTIADSEVIAGVVFAQTVTSRRMPTRVEHPRILLLLGEVSYPPPASMDLLEYVQSYKGFLDKLYQRIETWDPNVIVVEKGMHHYLQGLIAERSKMALILHAGRPTMDRLAACCHASLVSDLQYVGMLDLLQRRPLGTCARFELRHAGAGCTPLCCFLEPARPLLVSVVLRGAVEAVADVALLGRVAPLLLAAVRDATHAAAQVHLHRLLRLPLVARASHGDPRSINVGVQVSKLANGSDSNDEEEDDVWEVNVVDLNSCPPGHRGAPAVSPPVLIPTAATTAAESRGSSAEGAGAGAGNRRPVFQQRRHRLRFYKEGESRGGDDKNDDDDDAPLLRFLLARAAERDSRLLLLRGTTSLHVTTETIDVGPGGASTTAAASSSSVVPMWPTLRLPAGGPRAAASWAFVPTDAAEEAPAETLARRGFECAQRHALWLEQSTADYQSGATAASAVTQVLPIYATALMPLAEGDGGDGSDAAPAPRVCSSHVLNMSYGAVLEILWCHQQQQQQQQRADTPLIVQFFLSPTRTATARVTLELRALRLQRVRVPPLVTGTEAQCHAPAAEAYLALERGEALRDLAALADCVRELPTFDATPEGEEETAGTEEGGSTASTSARGSPVTALEDGAPALPTTARLRLLTERVAALVPLVQSRARAEEVVELRWSQMRSLTLEVARDYLRAAAEVERRKAAAAAAAAASVGPTTGGRAAKGSGGASPSNHSFTAAAAAALPAALRNEQWFYSHEDGAAVRLDEPTSLIALVLRRTWEGRPRHLSRTATAERSLGSSFSGDALTTRSPPEPQPLASRGAALAALLQSEAPSSNHRFLSLHSVAAGATTAPEVVVDSLFPQAFQVLQFVCTGERPGAVAASLGRCDRYQTDGGKTGAIFYVTKDRRFLLKQVKSTELRHFVEVVGARYFAHMHRRLSSSNSSSSSSGDGDDPDDEAAPAASALAKILGLYSVQTTRRRRSTGETTTAHQHFVLMENLTCACSPTTLYDLKGSQRNRAAEEGAAVRWDADLVRRLRDGHFFFCTAAEKRRLMRSLESDTMLLAEAQVMDYSLMTAVVAPADEIYVGIIDYLHPYTGVKVLESRVKSGLDTVLGHGGGATPTIIDPGSYRARFLRWMDCYFCVVPEEHSSLAATVAHP